MSAAAPVHLAAQRRQLTILFADLVGSTRLSTELDPEDMQDVIRAVLGACRDAIEATGGYVAKYMGDGVLAYFGFPDAHEDDAARAVQAALGLVAAVARLPTPHGRPLAVRVGIATGLAVVGEALGAGAAAELAVVGDTPNLAARLQGLAAPGAVVISDRTRALTAGLFDAERLPAAPLKGFADDEPAWRVNGPSATPSRFGQRHDRGLTPFIGREPELDAILAAWSDAVAGRGGVIGVVGPAGVGKCRLVYEAQRRIARTPHVLVAGVGAPIFTSSPFHIVAQMLRRRLRALGGEPLAALAAVLDRVGVAPDPALPLLADLLGLALPPTAAPLALRADVRRSALIDTVLALLDNREAQFPMLLLIEDLHWLDPSSLALLARLAQVAPARRLLILFTARDDVAVPDLPNARRIDVARLDAAEMRALLGAVDVTLSPDAVDSVVARSEGIPLFAEEIALLVATQTGDADATAIPATLSDLLMARLGGLGTALPLAQTAAVLGPRCSLDLLARVAEAHPAAIEAGVAMMVATGLVERSRTGIVFRHALQREAAYEALLRRDRRRLHARAAAAIAADFPALVADQPDVVAHHLTEAGSAEAVPAWLAAGRAMTMRSAYVEAERAFDRALALLARQPPSPARDANELPVRSALAAVAQINHGYSAARTVAALARARELAEAGGDLSRQFAEAVGQWGAASSAGDYATAGPLASQALRLARAHGGPEALGSAHMIALTSRYRVGNLLGAEEAFERGRAFFDQPAFVARAGAVEQTFGNAALVASLLGDDTGARERLGPVLALATASDAPYRQAMAAFMASAALAVAGQFAAAIPLAQRAIDLSDEHGFPQYTFAARIVLGFVRGDPAGTTMLRDGIAAMASTRLGAAITLYLTWLAAAEHALGDAAAAAAAIDRALTANPRERFYRPESLRVRATIALAAGDHAAARADVGEAIAAARAMGARSLHARAVATQAEILRARDGAVSRAT